MGIPRAVAVAVDGERVLIIKRFLRHERSADCVLCEERGWPGPECAGHHYAVLPGGHVEDGESAETAALRELHEETTLRARIDRQLWTGNHHGRPATYFLMAEVTGSPVLSGPEAEANRPDNDYHLMWATAEEFDHLNLQPAEIRAPLTDLLRGDGSSV
jgi:ADP-ribose pyrophosphatase YjhB (NUDIX family)